MQVTDRRSRVRQITFDRPDARNAFTAAAARELVDALAAAADADCRAVVLTGAGAAFSAGGDVRAMADREETTADAFDRLTETLTAVLEGVLEAPFPVIAQVNGDAVGAGTNLAAACDFAYAAAGARFGEVFGRVGLIPDAGGTFILRELVGLRRAKELTMTGRLFDAAEAAEMGLINRVCPPEDLDAAVDDLLDTLGEQATETLRLTKRGLHENLGRPFRDALEREAYLQVLAYGTDAHREGVEAFLEKRDPDFE